MTRPTCSAMTRIRSGRSGSWTSSPSSRPARSWTADSIDGVGQAVADPGVYELAIQAIDELAGPRHPFAGYLHVRLASLLYRHDDRPRALQHALEGEGILRDHLYLDLRDLSEGEAL